MIHYKSKGGKQMTTWKIGESYFGFHLIEKKELSELNCTGFIFHHEKSGAKLCFLQTTDNNKVFSVTFKTPPTNDTGVAHILEHAVLCGSEKYTAKDPFNELAKGSLNTFLNAMTYPDKTMYPIASCNEKDFQNMMDVYLNAVFYPNIYHKKGIFLQEGWRYTEKENETNVTGVVFNEMKGALSDPESRLMGEISKSIFGKTTYGFESGGDPISIIDLTYEDFLDFHKKLYHPSNAYLYLYGNLDGMAYLEFFDKEYLSRFEKIDSLPIIKETEIPKPNQEIYAAFPAENITDDLGYFAYNFKVGKCTNEKEMLALQILGYLLLETNASPLKNALREKGICEEAESYFDSSTLETVFSIIGKNGKKENFKTFCSVVEDVLKNICHTGFEQELLKSSLKKMEFLLREEDYGSRPKGLVYHTRQMKSWLHNEDPLECLKVLSAFQELKKEIQNGYLELLISDRFLEGNNKTKICFMPEWGKQEKEEALFQDKLQSRLSAMTAEEKTILEQDKMALSEFQNCVDTPEILAQIPILKREEIDSYPLKIQREEKNIRNCIVTFFPMNSKGIYYGQILFSANLEEDWIPYTGLLAEILGKIDTQKTSFTDLSAKTDLLFGGFNVSNDVYSRSKEDFSAYISLNFKILKEDLVDAFRFIHEIIFETNFKNKESLLKIIKTARLKAETYFQNQAHLTAIFRSRANISVGASIKEKTSGIAYYQFLCQIENELKNNPDSVIEKLSETAKRIFCQENFMAMVGCKEEDYKRMEEEISHLHQSLPAIENGSNKYTCFLSEQKEGFSVSSKVQYNVKSWDFENIHYKYSGKMQVLKTILTLEYLWTHLRVQGGAYGCGCNFQRNGGVYFYSYRDPNLRKTYETYEKLAEEISSFQADEREMTKYIIGTINRFDQPKTNSELLDYGTALYLTVVSDEMRQQERLEILNTTAEDIRNFQNLLMEFSKSQNICTIGSDESLKSEENYFDHIENLIQKKN